MQLIWFNAVLGSYEFGNKFEFEETNSLYAPEDITMLMEFASEEESLAVKVISELNAASHS